MAVARHKVETTFINAWAVGGDFEIVLGVLVSQQMRDIGIALVDVNFILKTGSVIDSDMLGSRGLWVVRGETLDGVWIDAEIAVRSTTGEVELLKLMRI